MTGNELFSNVAYIENYGESLMFEPIPLEFLSTAASLPQVLVTVDGIQALCPQLNCYYSFVTELNATIST
jgi:hypothetical protein